MNFKNIFINGINYGNDRTADIRNRTIVTNVDFRD